MGGEGEAFARPVEPAIHHQEGGGELVLFGDETASRPVFRIIELIEVGGKIGRVVAKLRHRFAQRQHTVAARVVDGGHAHAVAGLAPGLDKPTKGGREVEDPAIEHPEKAVGSRKRPDCPARAERDHRLERRMLRRGEGHLRLAQGGTADGANLTVGPSLRGDPVQRRRPVGGVIGIGRKDPAAIVAPAHVLHDDGIASG